MSLSLGTGLGLTRAGRAGGVAAPASPVITDVTADQVVWTHDGERLASWRVDVDGVEHGTAADVSRSYDFDPPLTGGELVAVVAVGPGGESDDTAYVPMAAPADPLLTAEELDSDTVHTETTHGGYAGELDVDAGGGFAAADTWAALDADPNIYDHAAAPATEYDFRSRVKTYDPNYATDRWSGYATAGATTPAYPVAAFSADDTTPDVGQSVAFTSTSTGSGLTYLWDFGDSTSSTAANPSKTYSAAGTYTVTLTVTDAYGQSDAETKTGYVVASVAYLLRDTFAGSGTLTGRTMDSGDAWTVAGGTWTVASGYVRDTAPDKSPNAFAHADAGAANFTARVTITPTDANNVAALLFRYVNGTNYLAVRMYKVGTTQELRFVSVSGGAESTLAASVTTTFNLSAPYTLEVVASGTGLTFKLNGATVRSTTSSTHQTATRCGMTTLTSSYTSPQFDNFEVV